MTSQELPFNEQTNVKTDKFKRAFSAGMLVVAAATGGAAIAQGVDCYRDSSAGNHAETLAGRYAKASFDVADAQNEQAAIFYGQARDEFLAASVLIIASSTAALVSGVGRPKDQE